MKYLLILTILITGFGCDFRAKEVEYADVPEPMVAPSIESVGEAAEDISTVTKDLGGVAKSITTTTVAIEKKDDKRKMVKEVNQLRREVPRIEKSRDELTGVTASLIHTQAELSNAQTRLEELQQIIASDRRIIEEQKGEIANRDENIRELEAEVGKATKRMLTWAILAGVVCIAVCAMLVFNGKGGIGLGVFGVFLIVGSTAASFILSHAWIGGLAIMFAVGVVGYKIWELCRSKRGNKELVATAEKLKKHLEPSERVEEFGDLVGDGQIGMIQSEGTKAIVREERAKLRGLVTEIVPRENRT